MYVFQRGVGKQSRRSRRGAPGRGDIPQVGQLASHYEPATATICRTKLDPVPALPYPPPPPPPFPLPPSPCALASSVVPGEVSSLRWDRPPRPYQAPLTLIARHRRTLGRALLFTIISAHVQRQAGLAGRMPVEVRVGLLSRKASFVTGNIVSL